MTRTTGLMGARGVVGLGRARGERGVFGVAAWSGAGHAVIMARLRVAVRGRYEAWGGHGSGLRPALRKVQSEPGQPPHKVQSGSGQPLDNVQSRLRATGRSARCSWGSDRSQCEVQSGFRSVAVQRSVRPVGKFLVRWGVRMAMTVRVWPLRDGAK
ncbi:hypothetical protein GCM10009733_027450 [Nonomuraea maheshkhaliensis]|uniref:Uncharacterized protein n=1 Tax=Nonomuraea maheshkhaliensis TaxID=419590 RepID=A0ABP4R113_9ACTN